MVIGIIGAMNEETEKLIDKMTVLRKMSKASMTFNFGMLDNKEVVVVTCGIGKVNAAICAQILVDDFHVDYVINVGIAGGLKEEIYPGDIVIASSLIYHDFDATFFNYKLGQVPRLDVFDFKCDNTLSKYAKESANNLKTHNVYEGSIVSGDQFISSKEKLMWLSKEFNAYACEMEGASIAHVCHLNKVPFIVIRSISDNAINGTHSDYETFKYIAVDNSLLIIHNMLKAM
ncbi:5'-methylthioadenosine/adenosylhomocysteine nucleosidase [Hathewaya histolytica]|uniref:5'-methylthioadenosine/adenosylhomocysteine nucleosidase n=1 Tax=Hathewaya histolytica TaxID=1498 RepID=UPI003B677A02